jgi:hypothetical protein
VKSIAPIGSVSFPWLWPGRYRLNLCGLLKQCPSDRTSSVFEVAADAVTDILFEIGCVETGR